MAEPNPLLALPVLTGDLARVEDQLRRSVQAEDPFLTEVASHLITAGGKRVRPAFCGRRRPPPAIRDMAPAPPEVVSGAVSVELVHLGSLYHDDVMDDAITRRTVESVNARWGNLKAILAGDFLLARASEIAASLGTEVAGLLAATIARLCEGQVLELQHTFDADPQRAGLPGLHRRQDRLVAGHGLPHRRHRGRAAPRGHRPADHASATATAWPSRSSTTSSTSSPPTSCSASRPATTSIEGVYTLPVLRVIAAGGPDGDRLGELLGRPLDDAQLAEARHIVSASGQIDEALASARDFAHEAAAALTEVTDTEAGQALVAAVRPPPRDRPGRRPALSTSAQLGRSAQCGQNVVALTSYSLNAAAPATDHEP